MFQFRSRMPLNDCYTKCCWDWGTVSESILILHVIKARHLWYYQQIIIHHSYSVTLAIVFFASNQLDDVVSIENVHIWTTYTLDETCWRPEMHHHCHNHQLRSNTMFSQPDWPTHTHIHSHMGKSRLPQWLQICQRHCATLLSNQHDRHIAASRPTLSSAGKLTGPITVYHQQRVDKNVLLFFSPFPGWWRFFLILTAPAHPSCICALQCIRVRDPNRAHRTDWNMRHRFCWTLSAYSSDYAN